ncbi:MAG: hypothetical protein N2Z79_00395, partial [Candidatus Omnitrophica bacterium]|nr:hypothetical protein [Candidatus Omnitrophota bacterium]
MEEIISELKATPLQLISIGRSYYIFSHPQENQRRFVIKVPKVNTRINYGSGFKKAVDKIGGLAVPYMVIDPKDLEGYLKFPSGFCLDPFKGDLIIQEYIPRQRRYDEFNAFNLYQQGLITYEKLREIIIDGTKRLWKRGIHNPDSLHFFNYDTQNRLFDFHHVVTDLYKIDLINWMEHQNRAIDLIAKLLSDDLAERIKDDIFRLDMRYLRNLWNTDDDKRQVIFLPTPRSKVLILQIIKDAIEKTTSSPVDYHHKETLYKDEPRLKFYFEETIKLNLKLITLSAYRRLIKISEDKSRIMIELLRQFGYEDIEGIDFQKIAKIVKEFKEKIDSPTYLDLAEARNLREIAKQKLEIAINLIEESKNIPAANAVLVSVAERFSEELILLIRNRIRRERKRKLVGFDTKIQRGWFWQGRYVRYSISTEDSVIFKIYKPQQFKLFWVGFRSMDKQINTEIKELFWLRDNYKRIKGIIFSLETQTKDRTQKMPEEKLRDIYEVLYKIHSDLQRAILGIKEIIRYSLELAMVLLLMGDFKTTRTILGVGLRFIEIRGKEVRDIIEGIQRGRLSQLRLLVEKRNQELINRTRNIQAALEKKDFDSALAKLYGLLRAQRLRHCFEEPELWGLRRILGYLTELIKKRQINKAKERLNIAEIKVKEAEVLGEFMQDFRNIYVESNLKDIRISEQEAFDMAFQRFIKKANLNKGSPKIKLWQIKFLRASFIDLEIENPLDKSQKIFNPLFLAVTDFIDLIETSHFKALLKSYHKRKPLTYQLIFNFINQNKFNFQALSQKEKELLFEKLTQDYRLSKYIQDEKVSKGLKLIQNLISSSPLTSIKESTPEDRLESY